MGLRLAGKIFISYRREESAANALSIAQYLEHQFGHKNVFVDVDMRAGANFPAVLEERLRECKVMLALLGPNWIAATDDEGQRRLDNPNDWVRLEIGRALARGITVIPVRVNGADLPKRSVLPTDVQGLLDRQAAIVTNENFRNDMAGLTRDIRGIPDKRRRAWRMATVGLASLLAVTACGFLLYRFAPVAKLNPANWISSGETAITFGPEWILFGSTTAGFADYMDLASVKQFGDHVAVTTRYPVDPSKPVVIGSINKLLPNAAYQCVEPTTPFS